MEAPKMDEAEGVHPPRWPWGVVAAGAVLAALGAWLYLDAAARGCPPADGSGLECLLAGAGAAHAMSVGLMLVLLGGAVAVVGFGLWVWLR